MLIAIFALFQWLLLALMMLWPWIHEPDLAKRTRYGFSAIALILLGPSLGATLVYGCACDPWIWSLAATIYCFLTLHRLSNSIDFEEACAQAYPRCVFDGETCSLVDTLINALGACCFIMAASLCLCNCSCLEDMLLYSGLWCYRIYCWLPRY